MREFVLDIGHKMNGSLRYKLSEVSPTLTVSCLPMNCCVEVTRLKFMFEIGYINVPSVAFDLTWT